MRMLEEAVEVCNPHRARRGEIAALVADGVFRMAMDSASSDTSRVTHIPLQSVGGSLRLPLLQNGA